MHRYPGNSIWTLKIIYFSHKFIAGKIKHHTNPTFSPWLKCNFYLRIQNPIIFDAVSALRHTEISNYPSYNLIGWHSFTKNSIVQEQNSLSFENWKSVFFPFLSILNTQHSSRVSNIIKFVTFFEFVCLDAVVVFFPIFWMFLFFHSLRLFGKQMA